MRTLIMAAATAASLALSVGAADAIPLAPVDGLSAAPAITLVSGGCGPYAHRGPFGGCRPFGGPRFFGRPHRPFYGHPFYPHRRFY